MLTSVLLSDSLNYQQEMQSVIIDKDMGGVKILDEKGQWFASAKNNIPLVLNIKDPFLDAPVPPDFQV